MCDYKSEHKNYEDQKIIHVYYKDSSLPMKLETNNAEKISAGKISDSSKVYLFFSYVFFELKNFEDLHGECVLENNSLTATIQNLTIYPGLKIII